LPVEKQIPDRGFAFRDLRPVPNCPSNKCNVAVKNRQKNLNLFRIGQEIFEYFLILPQQFMNLPNPADFSAFYSASSSIG
jgi:hypothetical protein